MEPEQRIELRRYIEDEGYAAEAEGYTRRVNKRNGWGNWRSRE
jgi:hypothetical protein